MTLPYPKCDFPQQYNAVTTTKWFLFNIAQCQLIIKAKNQYADNDVPLTCSFSSRFFCLTVCFWSKSAGHFHVEYFVSCSKQSWSMHHILQKEESRTKSEPSQRNTSLYKWATGPQHKLLYHATCSCWPFHYKHSFHESYLKSSFWGEEGAWLACTVRYCRCVFKVYAVGYKLTWWQSFQSIY